jgi:cell division protein FtsI (penicillin-binding protein 3)
MHDEMITPRSIKLKKIRLLFFTFLMFAGFTVVVVRLFNVQILQYKRFTDYSKNQYFQKVTFSPTRGRILDRNMEPLAMTVPMKSVFATPAAVENKSGAAVMIARDLKMDSGSVLARLEKKGHFAWIKRKVGDEEYEALKSRHLRGVMFVDEDRRFYPLKGTASRAVGFCGLDNSGLSGLEYLYDKTLSGEQVTIIAQKDATGKIYQYGEKPPESNFELVSTIDINTQFVAEKAVRKTFERYQPKSALAVVMDVRYGDILAMAEYPELDSNDFASFPSSSQKSLTVTQSYEPGSTFKIFVSAAAIDAGLTSPEEKIDCENGHFVMYGKTFKEAKSKHYQIMPLKDVIAKSSNIGMIKVGQKLGDKRLYEYMRKFGFGEKTGVDLPGEISGLLRPYHSWSAVSLPSISFGQEINTTPIQLVTALSVLGNGGMSVKPHLLKMILKDGKVVKEYSPPPSKRIISQSAAEQVIGMMRYTVTDGTGKMAGIQGYEIAGKTGTAQKFDNEHGIYITDRAISSFVALFPANRPVYAVLVVFDEPLGMGWGGEVAAPVAREIIDGIARHSGMPANNQLRYTVDWKNFRVSSLGGNHE